MYTRPIETKFCRYGGWKSFYKSFHFVTMLPSTFIHFDKKQLARCLNDWTSGLAFHSNATSTNVIWLLGDKAIYDWLKYEKNLLRNHWRVGEVTKNSTLVFGLLWRKLKQSFILGFSTQPVCKNCPKKWLKVNS